MVTYFGDGNVLYKLQLMKMRRECIYKNTFFRPLKACYGNNGHVLDGGGPKDSKNTLNSFLTIATETCFDKLVLSHIKSFESL